MPSQVRLWDLEAQRCAGAVPTGGTSGRALVTSMTSAWPGTDLLVVGLSNGHINVLDLRVASSLPTSLSSSRGAVVASLREHKRWIVNVAQARIGSVYALVSGSVLADVRFWDLRRSASVRSIQAHRGAMTSLAAHDFAPLIATGSQRQQVRVPSRQHQVSLKSFLLSGAHPRIHVIVGRSESSRTAGTPSPNTAITKAFWGSVSARCHVSPFTLTDSFLAAALSTASSAYTMARPRLTQQVTVVSRGRKSMTDTTARKLGWLAG